MKKLLIVLFVTCSLNVFSQINRESKTVLKDFILGYDSEISLKQKGIEINDVNTVRFDGSLTIVRLLEYDYTKDVVLVFVNHTLYSVRYFVTTERQYLKYMDKLYRTYNVQDFQGVRIWFNQYVIVEYNVGEDNEPESFVHYDIKLLEKYPQFKDF